MRKHDSNFIDIPLSNDTVFVYSVRRLLQKGLDKIIPSLNGIVLDLGCGEMPYKNYILSRNKKINKYIGVDIKKSKYHTKVKPDMYWNGRSIKLKNNSVDIVMATELFEHLNNIDEVLTEIIRILKRGGLLFFTTPFIWPLHETPNDQYRYTPYSLIHKLHKNGFKKIKVFKLGDYNASLAQMICIWIPIYKSTINNIFIKKAFSLIEYVILYPLIRLLLKKDELDYYLEYGENTISPGYYGIASK